MKTIVVGAGAMGGLFGALLHEAGNEVRLVDVREDHVRAVNTEGLKIEREDRVRAVRVPAVTDPRSPDTAELIIIFVKSMHTRAAAETARILAGPQSAILTLQNGMGNVEIIAEVLPSHPVVAGTTAHGSTLLGPGMIRHAGTGATVIGMWGGGDPEPARRIARTLTEAGIVTEVVDNVREVLWEKLLVNVGVNAVTALTGIANGQLLDLEVTRQLCREAVEEGAAVGRKSSVRIREDIVDHVFAVAAATGPNRSSMGQDVDRRRPTEIEAINGVVVREARNLGLDAPVNRTLTALIKTLEAHYGAV